MFSFKYSERPHTLAAKRYPDDIPEEEKTRRIVALQTLQRGIQRQLHEAAVGTTVDVLVDAVSRRRAWELSGRTPGNTVVNFPGRPEWIGRVMPIRVTRANPNSLSGEPVVDAAGADLFTRADRGAAPDDGPAGSPALTGPGEAACR